MFYPIVFWIKKCVNMEQYLKTTIELSLDQQKLINSLIEQSENFKLYCFNCNNNKNLTLEEVKTIFNDDIIFHFRNIAITYNAEIKENVIFINTLKNTIRFNYKLNLDKDTRRKISENCQLLKKISNKSIERFFN
jgi:hypothetical protein